MEPVPSSKVEPLRMKHAQGWIEAVLEKEVAGEDYSVIIGRVLHAEVNDLYWDGGKLTEDPLVVLAPDFKNLWEKYAGRDDLMEFMPQLKA